MKSSGFEGVKRVIQFNWPMYAAALVTIAVACAIITQVDPHSLWHALLLVGVALIAIQTIFSLVASYWVYDLSPLHHWQWLTEIPKGKVATIVNIHSGYDETTGALNQYFPDAQVATIDLYPALNRREPSIERARRLYAPLSQPLCSTLTDWPLPDSSIDMTLIAFSAHEVRSRDERVQLFKQVNRLLSPESGRVVLVEHLRDVANTVAYGPGVLHFLSAHEWLECAALSGLQVVKQYRLTPFVGIFILCRSV
jgi:SAM-dependent methyltransferase